MPATKSTGRTGVSTPKGKTRTSTPAKGTRRASSTASGKGRSTGTLLAGKSNPDTIGPDIEQGLSTPFEPLSIGTQDRLFDPDFSPYGSVDLIASDIADLGVSEQYQDTSRSGIVEGTHEIGRKTLTKIVAMAASEIDGFVPARNDFKSKIVDLLWGRIEGIKLNLGTSEAAIDMVARVHFGTDIPRASSELRENIARRFGQMTGLRVVEVNLRVQDIIHRQDEEN